MFAFSKGPAGSSTYDRVAQKFQDGYEKMRAAIEMDELTKHAGSIQEKLRTAELYKEARSLLKEANEFNIMDIPETRRSEIRDKRQNMMKLEKSAQDRLIAICNEVDPNVKQSRSATVGPSRPASAARVTPRPTRATAPASLPMHQNPVNRAALLNGVDKVIGERLLDEVLDNTGVRMDDVAGCHSAKAALEEAVILPALNPNLFKGLRQPVKGILLFGPPGNGKTLLAKAVAGESKQMFFNISASSLTSKWVGDSEKTIRGLFQIARNAQPSIIFIDEIDSILCERSEKDAEVSRRMKTEFLVQFDGATSSADDRILVIGATNRPHELDDAVLRRFPKRIMLNLPDEEARKELITKTLKKHNMMDGLISSDIRYIASNTSGFSNSDLVALCKEAAMVPIREIDRSKLSMTDGEKIRKIRASDFDTALRTIRPSTSQKIMSKLSDFSRSFGC
ncbi:Spastin homolog [Caenorhabditis elegans]|uniref:Isoform a of Spastin homolog n=1 Tax=Caenorhabditis elegans TaxID=6239 RepID=Q8MNV0-2|nr:Spastin homolog [Caenorhabditis elegans]CCD61426.1 Spastin homolog [Caenorhabditis elegans]|eukprot:NP_741586.1 Probable spastin homolog spas-1 [Caenorhabditis elegans]